MKIRKAVHDDFELINALFRELDTCSIQQQPEHFQRGERSEEYLLDLISNVDSDFLLCVVDEKVIGFSLLFLKETKALGLLVPCKYAYIQDFIISEGYRNQGYGSALLDASRRWASEHGAEYLRLSVIPNNEAGIRFYKKNGLLEQMITMECRVRD